MKTYTGNYPAGETFGKGFRRRLKIAKREEAEIRNSKSKAEKRYCGHVHGRTGQRCGHALV